MSAVTFATVQRLAADCLAANASFAGIDIFLELDPAASPEALAAQEKAFEDALNGKGLAVVVLTPHAEKLDETVKGVLSLDLVVPVAICENAEVNRGQPDPKAVPPRAPLGRTPQALVEAGLAALLGKFRFPAQPVGRPEFSDGYFAYSIMATRRHRIEATA